MGTANQLFAQGKTDEAVKMAFEVIRNCPRCPEPYQLLREVLLGRGFETHAHKLSLFIASFDPSTDADCWIQLATDSQRLLDQNNHEGDKALIKIYEKNNYLNNKKIVAVFFPKIFICVTIAIMCYRNAYAKSHNGDIKWEIGNLYRKCEQWTLALQSYKNSLRFFPGERGDEALKKAREFARQIYSITRSMNGVEAIERMKMDALEMLKGTIERHEQHVTDEDINYAADLMIELEQYEQESGHAK